MQAPVNNRNKISRQHTVQSRVAPKLLDAGASALPRARIRVITNDIRPACAHFESVRGHHSVNTENEEFYLSDDDSCRRNFI